MREIWRSTVSDPRRSAVFVRQAFSMQRVHAATSIQYGGRSRRDQDCFALGRAGQADQAAGPGAAAHSACRPPACISGPFSTFREADQGRVRVAMGLMTGAVTGPQQEDNED